ncbi:hypothetical protein SU69_07180 [Thermosipho melanesiensis]|uniref:Uncharacterized protein n=2 Tax=Thermosipho melanesiensis TaxID=46541 RepID=A6LMW3_THEM4|nr:hypothetical protein [Thermosipho melanesiensis]ABR31264.1 hypothetical protein Tmel_1417 [Thermosipho melanesiensis BI429]APT74902.1 hypothetical protein BW47_07505 [Thermosipho melanesiensis]OOC36287.1 hypothetical protein SU68_07250 [Thermosipho melanesiensis]OOC37105.1 hypothetical protein SU69_07180 [Thermosipho melanesiensis]OOC37857.1 hypothetical protein SU70_07190 [Thermosipho melanesiensis]
MIKKYLIFLIVVMSFFSFAMRKIENPALNDENFNSFGFSYSTYFSSNWITKFGLFYGEQEQDLFGKIYLFTEDASTESMNKIGYLLNAKSSKFQWGIDFEVGRFKNSTSEGYSFNMGVGFLSEVVNYVKIGAFVKELTLFAQSPFEFFKPDVGINLIVGNEMYRFLTDFVFVKQEYFQFSVGPELNFDLLGFGLFWSPEYIISSDSFFNKLNGYIVVNVEKIRILLDFFYSVDRNTITNLPMHYENALYGYSLAFWVGF